MATQATFRIWRGDPAGGTFQDYTTPVEEGMVVLDAVHRIQAQQATDLVGPQSANRIHVTTRCRMNFQKYIIFSNYCGQATLC